jgi:hypothetical protein
MRLSLQTLLLLRQAALALVSALEAAALEAYGWTPRAARRQEIDNTVMIDA